MICRGEKGRRLCFATCAKEYRDASADGPLKAESEELGRKATQSRRILGRKPLERSDNVAHGTHAHDVEIEVEQPRQDEA